jgi:hypothetical protein
VDRGQRGRDAGYQPEGPYCQIPRWHLESGRVMCEVYAGVNGATGWVFVPVGDWVLHWADDLTDLWPMNDQAFRRKYRPAGDLMEST